MTDDRKLETAAEVYAEIDRLDAENARLRADLAAERERAGEATARSKENYERWALDGERLDAALAALKVAREALKATERCSLLFSVRKKVNAALAAIEAVLKRGGDE